MNYMANLNRFYDSLLGNELAMGQIVLWQALMQIANRKMWPEWFSAPTNQLRVYTRLSESGIRDAATELARMGLIEIRGSRKSKEYHLVDLAPGVQNSVQNPE